MGAPRRPARHANKTLYLWKTLRRNQGPKNNRSRASINSGEVTCRTGRAWEPNPQTMPRETVRRRKPLVKASSQHAFTNLNEVVATMPLLSGRISGFLKPIQAGDEIWLISGCVRVRWFLKMIKATSRSLPRYYVKCFSLLTTDLGVVLRQSFVMLP